MVFFGSFRVSCFLFTEDICAIHFLLQAMLLLDAFNKDRASLPQPNQNPPQLAPVPLPNPPDPHTQEMINEKLKKAEDLGMSRFLFSSTLILRQLS